MPDDSEEPSARPERPAQPPAPNGGSGWNVMAEAWSLAFLFPAAIAGGFLLGLGADKLFGSNPWGKVIGTGFGIVAAFVSLFRIALRKDDGNAGNGPSSGA